MKILKVILKTIIILVIAAMLVLTGVYLHYNTEKTKLTNKERVGTPGQYIQLSAGITHYQLDGPDTGQVVILAHGFSVPYFIWDGTYEFLVKQGFRVLRYDMYGRGYSDRPHTVYNNDLYYNQLLELIAKLHLKSPVNLAGISFGGEMITGFTCRYPDKVNKVILLDPGYGNEAPAVPPVMTNYYEATRPDKRANGQLTDFKYPERHPDWVKQYRVQMIYTGFRYALVSTLYHYKDNGRETNTCLNSRHKQVLLIWGKEDATVPFRFSDSIRSVLKTDFFPVDDAAHLPSIEQAEKVNAKILSFLRGK